MTEITSAAEAAAAITRRKNQVDVSVDEATPSGGGTTKRKARKKEGISAEEAKKTEHIGSDGEKSYGQKMGESIVTRKTRFSTEESVQ